MNNETKIYITLPIDILWQDASEEDYDTDATDSGFLSHLENALHAAGYDADCVFSSVSMTKIEDDNGLVHGYDYDNISHIIDSIEVDYVDIAQADELDTLVEAATVEDNDSNYFQVTIEDKLSGHQTTCKTVTVPEDLKNIINISRNLNDKIVETAADFFYYHGFYSD